MTMRMGLLSTGVFKQESLIEARLVHEIECVFMLSICLSTET